MVFRLLFSNLTLGGHVHVRVFQAKEWHLTWQLNGTLTFDAAGWAAFAAACAQASWMKLVHDPEDVPPAIDDAYADETGPEVDDLTGEVLPEGGANGGATGEGGAKGGATRNPTRGKSRKNDGVA
jgi:hypothetical protein